MKTVEEINSQLRILEERILNERTWLSYNSSSISYDEYKQRDEYIQNMEKERDELYEELEKAKTLGINNASSPISEPTYTTSNIDISTPSNNYESDNVAIKARKEAQHRFFGMNKFQQTVAKITGKHKKFKKLWYRAADMLSEEQEKEVAEELGKMFR